MAVRLFPSSSSHNEAVPDNHTDRPTREERKMQIRHMVRRKIAIYESSMTK